MQNRWGSVQPLASNHHLSPYVATTSLRGYDDGEEDSLDGDNSRLGGWS